MDRSKKTRCSFDRYSHRRGHQFAMSLVALVFVTCLISVSCAGLRSGGQHHRGQAVWHQDSQSVFPLAYSEDQDDPRLRSEINSNAWSQEIERSNPKQQNLDTRTTYSYSPDSQSNYQRIYEELLARNLATSRDFAPEIETEIRAQPVLSLEGGYEIEPISELNQPNLFINTDKLAFPSSASTDKASGLERNIGDAIRSSDDRLVLPSDIDKAMDLLIELQQDNAAQKVDKKAAVSGKTSRSKPVVTTLLENEGLQETNTKDSNKREDKKKESFGKVVNYESEVDRKSHGEWATSLFSNIHKAMSGLLSSIHDGISRNSVPKSPEAGKKPTKPDVTKPEVSRLGVDAGSDSDEGTEQENEAEQKTDKKNRKKMTGKQVKNDQRGSKNQEDKKDEEKRMDQADGTTKRVDSMRATTLVLPFEVPRDESIAPGMDYNSIQHQADASKHLSGSEHRYHMNTGSFRQTHTFDMDAAVTGVYENGMNPYGTFKTFARRFHPGDTVYGSIETMKPIYSQRIEGNPVLLPRQSNDLYFLVMVGAFCVMAVAMVLAAGLFVYRVQQNRKTNAETDYPTYGVVGPNNMGAKCGYFGNNHGLGLVMEAGKTNSVGGVLKGSPDCFSPNDSGICGFANKKSGNKKSPSDGRPPSFMASQQNAARMYHYQHQKQQMISSDRTSIGRHTSASDLDSEEENEDGNYTVYECPGLASAHDMEIKNPLFNDDRSP